MKLHNITATRRLDREAVFLTMSFRTEGGVQYDWADLISIGTPINTVDTLLRTAVNAMYRAQMVEDYQKQLTEMENRVIALKAERKKLRAKNRELRSKVQS